MQDRITSLIISHWLGTISPEEKAELDAWARQSPDNRKLLEEIHDDNLLAEKLALYYSANGDATWKKTMRLIETGAPVIFTSTRRKRQRIYWAAAAAIVLLLLGSGYFYFLLPGDGIAGNVAENGKVITHSTHKATLILEDGHTVDLEKVSDSFSIQQGNAMLQLRDSQLVYQWIAPAPSFQWNDPERPLTPGSPERYSYKDTVYKAPVYNTVKVPAGSHYKLTLPDGSRVWLNAGTSIRYPVTRGMVREVTLIEGEAYFEVNSAPPGPPTDRRDKLPGRGERREHSFVVSIIPFRGETETVTIEVLGTHFNVSAYKNEAVHTTTLLEGKVKMTKGGQEVILTPGREAQWQPGGRLKEAAAASGRADWRNGVLHFSKTPLYEVIPKLERWYNVSVNYKTGKVHNTISGNLELTSNLKDVLEILGQQFGLRMTLNEKDRIIEILPLP